MLLHHNYICLSYLLPIQNASLILTHLLNHLIDQYGWLVRSLDQSITGWPVRSRLISPSTIQIN